MRLTTFTAPDMHIAMEHIRESMGEETVILSSKPAPNGDGISVTVAVEASQDDNDDYDSTDYENEEYDSSDNHAIVEEIEEILRFHSTPPELLDSLIEAASNISFEQDITQDGIAKNIEKLLGTCFHFSPLAVDRPDFTMMLIGPPGVGKTMAIAKLAAQLAIDKSPICVISTDNNRAGGIEQLSAFTSILGLDLTIADTPAMLRKCLNQCGASQRILIDSAGSNPYDGEQLAELKSMLKAAGTVEPVLTIPAGLDSAEACHISEIFSTLGARRIIVSRADAARRYGSLLAAAEHADMSFCNISNSAKVVEGVSALDATQMSHMLTRYLT